MEALLVLAGVAVFVGLLTLSSKLLSRSLDEPDDTSWASYDDARSELRDEMGRCGGCGGGGSDGGGGGGL